MSPPLPFAVRCDAFSLCSPDDGEQARFGDDNETVLHLFTSFLTPDFGRRCGSTAGPFGGVGGAARTWFRMTVLHSDDAMLLLASTQFSDQFYGAAPFNKYEPPEC